MLSQADSYDSPNEHVKSTSSKTLKGGDMWKKAESRSMSFAKKQIGEASIYLQPAVPISVPFVSTVKASVSSVNGGMKSRVGFLRNMLRSSFT